MDIDADLLDAVTTGDLVRTEALLRHGANANQADPYEGSLLMVAAYIGEIDMVRLLLRYGADVRHQNEFGEDAVARASSVGREDIVVVVRNAQLGGGRG